MTERQTAKRKVAQEQMFSCRDRRSPYQETPRLASRRLPEQVSVHSSLAMADIGSSKFCVARNNSKFNNMSCFCPHYT